MDKIAFDDFKRVDIRIGKVVSAKRVEDSEKLLRLEVDFGDLPDGGKRQIIAGVAKFYEPEYLIGKLCPFVVNLETKMLAGLESQGMILAADDNGPVLMHPNKEIKPGCMVR